MILVTGGTGLLGSHLLFNLISAGHKVRSLKRETSDLKVVSNLFSYYSKNGDSLFREIDWFDGDVMDICSLDAAMNGVSEVYHCAAVVSFVDADCDIMMKVNGQGTANVMDVALTKGVRKVCHVSSIAALGRETATGIIDENCWWKDAPGNSNYSISKYNSEREAWRAAEEGLNVVIVNPSIIVGPGNWAKGSSQMFSKSAKGLKYYADGVSGFVDVRDVCKTMIGLMQSEISKQRFIVSSENNSFRNFFNKVHDEFGVKRPHVKAGWFLTELAWRMDTLRSYISGGTPLITKDSARSAHQKHYFANEKIREILGFEFISTDQMIKDTCTAYRATFR